MRRPTPTSHDPNQPLVASSDAHDLARPQPAPGHVIQCLRPRHTSIQPLPTSLGAHNLATPQPPPSHVIQRLRPHPTSIQLRPRHSMPMTPTSSLSTSLRAPNIATPPTSPLSRHLTPTTSPCLHPPPSHVMQRLRPSIQPPSTSHDLPTPWPRHPVPTTPLCGWGAVPSSRSTTDMPIGMCRCERRHSVVPHPCAGQIPLTPQPFPQVNPYPYLHGTPTRWGVR